MAIDTGRQGVREQIVKKHMNAVRLYRKIDTRLSNNEHVKAKIGCKEEKKINLKIFMAEIKKKEESDEKLETTNTGHINRYGGSRSENQADWLRQYKNFGRLYKEYSDKNLHLLAMQYMTGEAGKYIDTIQPEPSNWSEFKTTLEKRFGDIKIDKTSLMKVVLTRKNALRKI